MHPLPRAWTAGALFVLLALAYALELLTQGNQRWSIVVFCAAMVIAWTLWRQHAPGRDDAPRRLRLCCDGTARIFTRGGAELRAKLEPNSVRLGSLWLLVLVTEAGRRDRLLLGPGNLHPAQMAALGRWLRQPPADPFRVR